MRHELAGVGENLQDHLQVRFVYACNGPGSLNEVWHSRWQQLLTGVEYVLTRRGILTIGAGAVGAFARSRPDVELPDIQFHFLPLSADRPGQGLHTFSGVTATRVPAAPREPRHASPIASADPAAQPRIVSNYLAAEADRRVLLDGMKLVRRATSQPAFAKYVVREHLPGPETASDEALMAYARAYATTVFHPCGTCKMGSDPKAVVDARLKVHGHRRPARGRCLHHADHDLGQHQCAHHHDRREGRRHDPRGCPRRRPCSADGFGSAVA